MAVVAALACGQEQIGRSGGGLNLILVSLTNVRPDHMGIYGYPRRTTPHLDSFFTTGIVFENAYTHAPWTLPVAASLFTSTFPLTHRTIASWERLDPHWLTLAETLGDAGYQTAGLTGGAHYNRRFNLAQGFDLYLDEENYDAFGLYPAMVPEATRRQVAFLGLERLVPVAIDWLENHSDEPFFLFLQGFDAHCPFQPRPPFNTRFDPEYAGTIDFTRCLWTSGPVELTVRKSDEWLPARGPASDGHREVLLSRRDLDHLGALYDGEIAQADAALGALFEALEHLDLVDRSLVVLLSEHGDLLGEHGRLMRGGPHVGTFYDQVLHIPLLLRHPSMPGPRRERALVQIVDLLPTLLELLEIEDPQRPTREGLSLAPLLRGDVQEVNSHLFAGSRFLSTGNRSFVGLSLTVAVRTRTWKLIRDEVYDLETRQLENSQTALYNVAIDPDECRNLAADRPDLVAQLEHALERRFGTQLLRSSDFEKPPPL